MDQRRLRKAFEPCLNVCMGRREDHVIRLILYHREPVFALLQSKKITEGNRRKNKFNPSKSSDLKPRKTHNEYVNTSKFLISFLKQFHLQKNYAL